MNLYAYSTTSYPELDPTISRNEFHIITAEDFTMASIYLERHLIDMWGFFDEDLLKSPEQEYVLENIGDDVPEGYQYTIYIDDDDDEEENGEIFPKIKEFNFDVNTKERGFKTLIIKAINEGEARVKFSKLFPEDVEDIEDVTEI